MLLQVALQNLRRNRRRTWAILLTVAVGTGSLFIFHGFNTGIMNQYRDNTVHSRYGHGEISTHGYHATVYEKPWEHWIDNPTGLGQELRQVPGVEQVFPRVAFFALLTNGKITVSGRGQGVDGPAEAAFFYTLNIEEGHNLASEPDGIVLGKGLAHALDVKVGDRITALGSTIFGSMNAADFTVTGIFHTGAKEFDDVVFRIPLAAAQQLIDSKQVESIALGMTGIDAWPQVARFIVEKHPELEATPFAVLDKVYYQNSVDWLDSQFGVIQAIILTIIILGIFNSVSTGVLERKQEIGNLRANGESVADVMNLLLLEGLVLGIAGALLGVGAAWLLNNTALKHGLLMPPAPGLTRQFHVLVELQPHMALSTFVMGSATALVGTLVAGWRIARLDIAAALRSA